MKRKIEIKKQSFRLDQLARARGPKGSKQGWVNYRECISTLNKCSLANQKSLLALSQDPEREREKLLPDIRETAQTMQNKMQKPEIHHPY